MADNIVNFEQNVDKEQFEQLTKSFSNIQELTGIQLDSEVIAPIASILSMNDEHFSTIASTYLSFYEKTLNTMQNKIMLCQILNVSNVRMEDLSESFSTLRDVIDQELATELSAPKRDFLKQLFEIMFNAIQDSEGVAKRTIQIPIEKCHEDAKIPTYANSGDAGMDIYALDDYEIKPGETKLIPTGLKVAIPMGYELQVRPKSGRALKTKLRVANTPGTIDSGYRNEIGVIIENVEPPIKDIEYEFNAIGQPIIKSILHGESFFIGKGEKFAQLVLSEVPKANFFEVKSVDEFGGDRGGGFGSSSIYDKNDPRYMSDIK